jgi:hypothetical protein
MCKSKIHVSVLFIKLASEAAKSILIDWMKRTVKSVRFDCPVIVCFNKRVHTD